MTARCLLISHASGVAPDVQRRRERALLETGALGELHLHVSTLAGEVLGIGAFHLDPGAEAAPGGPVLWRRTTGGRAIAAGDGFLLVTLALPHRSALVADERFALAPEQVMNRCVRGLLRWLERRGAEAVYPGLDLLTVARRALAHLSFAEDEAGPTLFQAVVALRTTFATTPHLLDRLDPRGLVPAHIIAPSQATSLAELRTGGAHGELDVATAAAELTAAYAETFTLDSEELDPQVTELMLADDADSAPDAELAPLADATSATEHGLLGPVTAAARVERGRIAAFALTGDFIAPAASIRELARRLVGRAATASEVAGVLDDVLDGSRGYLLGLKPAELRRLAARVVSAT